MPVTNINGGIIVTQNFSGTRLTKKSGAYQATDVYTVTGTGDPDQAIEACVPAGAPWRSNPAMFAMSREASPLRGPQAWTVTVTYAFGDPGLCASTPLNEATEINWQKDRFTIPRALDTFNNPIVNSAGDPFTPQRTRILASKKLIIRKWLPAYDVNLSLAYEDHVNDAPVSVVGVGTVDAGNCYCEYFEPAQAYTQFAPYVKVEFAFLFRVGNKPFQFKPIDQGRNGWFEDAYGKPQRGPICDISGNQVTFDVFLDGAGAPIDDIWYIWGAMTKGGVAAAQDPIDNPNLPPGLQYDLSECTNDVNTLIWPDVEEADFSALGA